MRTIKAITATFILALATQVTMAQLCNATTGTTGYFLQEGLLKVQTSSSGDFLFSVKGQKSNAVQSPFDARVLSVFEIDGTYAIVLQTGDYFFTIGNLKNAVLKKDELIKKGAPIGEAVVNEEKKHELEVIVMGKDRKKVTCEMVEKYLAGL